MGKVTLQTIADRLGVSRMTVSNAFSRPDQLSAELRDKIMAAADELGYVGPDPAARALATGSAGTVGVLLTDTLSYAFEDEFAARFLAGIAEELAPPGLALTLLTSSGPAGSVQARDVPMDGALIYSCDETSSALSWLKRRNLPLVLVDQAPSTEYSSVNIDDRRGAQLAAQHVVELGHRNIAVVTSNVAGPVGLIEDPTNLGGGHTIRQRMAGWLEVLAEAGIDPTVVQVREYGADAGGNVAELLFGLPDRPTAVLCYSDATAYGVVRAASRLGVSVPDDLSVVGFDDVPLASRMTPPLTTVRQDGAAKGRAAAAMLVAAIARDRTGSDTPLEQRVLPVELVIRASTTAAR